MFFCRILVMWNFYISEAYNVIIFSTLPLDRRISWFRCLEDDILSILIFDPILVFVFLVRMIVRFKNRQQILKPLTDLKEPSMDVGVVVDGAVLVVAHNLDLLLMQLCSCSCNASSSSTPPWKRTEKFKKSWLMPYDWQHKVFFVRQSLSSAAFRSFLFCVWFESPVKLWELCCFAPGVRPSGSQKNIKFASKATLAVSS